MKPSELMDFVKNRMRMSHVYQPFVIIELLEAGGQATVRQLAQAMAAKDEALLLQYEQRIGRYPMRVLKQHGVITKDRNGLVSLNVENMTYEQRAELRAECEKRIGQFLSQRGLNTWNYSFIETDPVPNTIRYEVLKRDGSRCVLSGVSAKAAVMHVDHIVPRSKGGSNAMENLQTLCGQCNNGKSNRDMGDFRNPGLG